MLEILENYLNAWCEIIFSYYHKNPDWASWKSPYFIDCFSGRGMYHKNGEYNSVKGSPIIAIEILIKKKKILESCNKMMNQSYDILKNLVKNQLI